MTSGIQFSGKGALAGFVADKLLGTSFPIGTAIGALYKNLSKFDPNDMNAAYSETFNQAKAQFQSGDLEGMARGLFDKAAEWLGGGVSENGQPNTNEAALAMLRPRADGDAQKEAQSKFGFGGWGKTLLIGGGVLAGLSLLNNFSLGGFGMPMFGAGMANMGMFDPGMLMYQMQNMVAGGGMTPGMMNPAMMGMDPSMMMAGMGGGGGGLTSLALLAGGGWLLSKMLKGAKF
ncbi:MAG: hypothetical protein RIT81_46720 [Deltaproteobacteria bacterium]